MCIAQHVLPIMLLIFATSFSTRSDQTTTTPHPLPSSVLRSILVNYSQPLLSHSLSLLITHPIHQSRRSQRGQRHIAIDTNVHRLSVMARQRPVRVSTIASRHMVEHRRQNREFRVRLPRPQRLGVWLRARESRGQRHGVAEDQQHQGQRDQLPPVSPDVVDFEVWAIVSYVLLESGDRSRRDRAYLWGRVRAELEDGTNRLLGLGQPDELRLVGRTRTRCRRCRRGRAMGDELASRWLIHDGWKAGEAGDSRLRATLSEIVLLRWLQRWLV